ncbi:AMP-binding protein [Undibacterium curvum]|uniref:AMP-binding protein n=1 Tax=Undibacterium curvum TaxID=2762294 RepID=A0ABR6ZZR8_9BURK|nr:AMP-binding protein [Undibacterium curvum]MBC3930160.1 AMP-binding protein [Undibacterium curvum]
MADISAHQALHQTAHLDTFTHAHLPPAEFWPERSFALPELKYPEQFNCVDAFLDKAHDAQFANKPAILSAELQWTYAELLAQVNRIAHVLTQDMGVIPGNRVLLRGTNHAMLAASFLAVLKVGAVAVPTMPLLRAKELGVMIDKARISHAICDFHLKAEMEEAQATHPELRQLIFYRGGENSLESRMAAMPAEFTSFASYADDVCLIGFTSGTTGTPKATMHFHRDMLAICDCFPRSILKVRESDIFIGTPPLAFTFGLGGLLLFPLRYGATTVLSEKMTPDALLQAIVRYQATVCFTAPTFYRQMALLAKGMDLRCLRETVSAGEMLPISTRQAWQEATGLRMIDGIGATEMLHIFISAAGDQVRPGATGKPVPGYQACILDADGQPAPPGVVGRLAVKGPTGCRYLADERQLNYVHQGWNLTGDAYEMDNDGYFYYRARTDDMIISAGYNIAGPEVEDAILLHPAVAECAVIGIADEQRGQLVKAFVVLRAGQEASEQMVKAIQDFVKQSIAPYKYPRAIEFRSSLPRTETGKLQRFRLREASTTPPPAAHPSAQ